VRDFLGGGIWSERFIGFAADRIPNVTLSAGILLLGALGDDARVLSFIPQLRVTACPFTTVAWV